MTPASVTPRRPRLLFVVNNAAFFVSHRLPIAVEARRQGYEVAVAAPAGAGVAEVLAAGFPCLPIRIVRGAVTPGADLAAVIGLIRIFRRWTPDIVHAVTLKPVVFAGIAARIARVPRFVAAISGLGYAFIDRGSRRSAVRPLVERLCRLALAHPATLVIFQNDADRDEFLAIGAAAQEDTVLIRGSGVDLTEFRPAPEPDGLPVVVLPARMLRDKGIAEFSEAAGMLKAKGVSARFVLVGDVDPGNPASCRATELRCYVDAGLLDWWGHRSDMPAVMGAAHVVVLPSYREGFPRVLMEAAAAGRAVVTTDVPGCRDAIVDGVTGLLVPPRNAAALADAIGRLLADRTRRRAMGQAGRARAEHEFGIARVVAAHIDVYRALAAIETMPAGAGAERASRRPIASTAATSAPVATADRYPGPAGW